MEGRTGIENHVLVVSEFSRNSLPEFLEIGWFGDDVSATVLSAFPVSRQSDRQTHYRP